MKPLFCFEALTRYYEVSNSSAAYSCYELLTPQSCNTEETKSRQTGDFLLLHQPVLHFELKLIPYMYPPQCFTAYRCRTEAQCFHRCLQQ